jgi:hypothetical protein
LNLSKSTRENILHAPENQHNAFHTLFAWGYPALMVAQVLNAKWLAHEAVLVPIPMPLLRGVLRFMRSKGSSLREEDLGITEVHRAHLRAKK